MRIELRCQAKNGCSKGVADGTEDTHVEGWRDEWKTVKRPCPWKWTPAPKPVSSVSGSEQGTGRAGKPREG